MPSFTRLDEISLTVKWQDHVYDFKIMICNQVSDSGKSNDSLVRRNFSYFCPPSGGFKKGVWKIDIEISNSYN